MRPTTNTQTRARPLDTEAVETALFGGCVQQATVLCGSSARAPSCPGAPPQPESLCPRCGSDLTHPLDWEHPTDDLWLLTLRCPECEDEWVVVMDPPLIERFIARLHAQKRALARDLARLSATCFLEQAKRFVAALQADRIVPADF